MPPKNPGNALRPFSHRSPNKHRHWIGPWLTLIGSTWASPALAQSPALADSPASAPSTDNAAENARPVASPAAPSTSGVSATPATTPSGSLAAGSAPAPEPAAPTAPAATATQPAATPQTAPAATTAPVLDNAPVVPNHFRPSFTTWDANLEGGYGRYFPDTSSLGFVRGRAGILHGHDPFYYAVGLTYEWSNQTPWGVGVQGEILRIDTGLWMQLGVLLDSQIRPGANLALGWSILGVEAQLRSFEPEPYGLALLGKIRIPISFIAMAFR